MDEMISEIEKFLKERNWDELSPSDVAKSISIEAAELLELFQWGDYNIEETKNDKVKMEEIKKELADVLIYALDMSRILDINPKDIIREKLKQNAKKFPAELVRGERDQKGNYSKPKAYYRIKKKHREENS